MAPTITDDEKAVKSARAKLVRTATRYHKLRAGYRETRAEMDAQVREAREAGATYKEIAEDIDLSVAWVQGSLGRTA